MLLIDSKQELRVTLESIVSKKDGKEYYLMKFYWGTDLLHQKWVDKKEVPYYQGIFQN